MKTFPAFEVLRLPNAQRLVGLYPGGYSNPQTSKVRFNPYVETRSLPNYVDTLTDDSRAPTNLPRPQRTAWHGFRRKIPAENSSDQKTQMNHPFPELCPTVCPTMLHLAHAPENQISTSASSSPEYADLLDRMFRIESVLERPPFTPDELLAEEHFRKNVTRLSDGRFQVSLPFKGDPASLGHSKSIALRQFGSLERRLRKSKEARDAYNAFMQDYWDSGHMEVAPPLPHGKPHFYLPHHSVHRPGDPPQKIRVVFNASQKTMSNQSLNDILLPGPRLQLDITEVLTRFRLDRFVFVADIRQMFRQLVHPESDRDFLRILWRFHEEAPLQEFRLCTVTYGTAAAPFLAGRVLKEIADVHHSSHPEASNILQSRTYVDDLNGGSNDLQTAFSIRRELQELLSMARLELRKWAANDTRLLSGIPSDHLLPAMTSVLLEDDGDASTKILGLSWQPHTDSFHYVLRPVENITTKRQLASQIARLYDPLGWLMPLTVCTRIIFRTVVQNHYQWDDILPRSVVADWQRLARELPELACLRIPRHVSTERSWLIGFCDASERAYGAALYLVSSTGENAKASLIIAKARMAPIKAMTLPRLELCAAQLLAKTITKTLPTLNNLSFDRVVALSDSTIALSWITVENAPLWKVFVGNRVADIHENVSADHWFHVPSMENSADHASRGLTPKELIECKQWWHGPSWLTLPQEQWPVQRIRPSLTSEILCEARTLRIAISSVSSLTHGTDTLENRFSSWKTLQCVVAFCLRYIHQLKVKRSDQQRQVLQNQYQDVVADKWENYDWSEKVKPLSTDELQKALDVLVRRAQAQALSTEIIDAQATRPKLKITRSLGLFLDSNGTLRVGGRLRNSQLPDHQKHPALLPSRHQLTTLLIENSHKILYHAGPLATLHHLRSRFWIVNGKNVVRRQLSKCVLCFTVRPKPFEPEMGQLPAARTQIDAPFATTGVDYAGPFPVSIAGLRKNRTLDCYLAIFVCFATKAVHIEVVTDLTTPGFLQALHRFVARRGNPHTIWSDNGRNFLGAANELGRIRSLLLNPEAQSTVIQDAASHGTTWKFIPPSAPFFGGLWEAAVKQAKRLLKNCLRNQVPTLETFITISTQVEAVLNSRPLTAMSSSPDDLSVLTPAHFLIFRPLTLPALDPQLDDRTALKDRHKFSQHVLQTFWQRWQKEYLLEVQGRTKWDVPDGRPAQIGDIVLVIDDNAPPLSWKLGKIVSVYPGKDGITRVADLRTPTGTLSRPVRKLCPLPDVCEATASTVGEDVSPNHLPT